MSTVAPHRRTLWEEGRRPGRLVVLAAGLLTACLVLLDLRLFDELTLLFDVAFVLVCTAAALAVRPRDFFVVGVFPPLLMAATIVVLALTARGSVADPADGPVQAFVSGLAHHAGALVTGYAVTLAVLALRQVAIRHSGTIRARSRSRPARAGEPPRAPRRGSAGDTAGGSAADASGARRRAEQRPEVRSYR